MSTPNPRRKGGLSPDDRDRIIALKLDGVHTKAEIAAMIPCSPTTVQRAWDAYREERSKARLSSTVLALEEQLERLERNALACRKGAMRAAAAEQYKAEASFISAERQAIESYAKLSGLSVERVEMQLRAQVEVTQQQAEQMAEVLGEMFQDPAIGLSPEQQAKAGEAYRRAVATIRARHAGDS